LRPSGLWTLAPGVAGTIAWHSALLRSGLDRIPGDRGDARSTIYLTEHWYQVFRGQAEALSPAMFYPVKGTLGYSEVMFLHGIPYSLLRASGLDMFSAVAVPLVLFSFLNYVACLILLRRIIGLNAIASVAGAMFFAFNNPRFNHVGHFAYQCGFLLPVIAGCLIRFGQSEALTQRKAFVLLAVAAAGLAVQFLILPYQAWFITFWLCLFTLIAALLPSARRALSSRVHTFTPAILGSMVVFLVAMIPFFAVYMPVRTSVGTRSYTSAHELTPDAWSLVQMSDRNYIWGWLSAAIDRVHPLFSTELNVAIGLVPSIAMLGLIIWALCVVTKDLRVQQRNGTHHVIFAAMILSSAAFYGIGMRYGKSASPWHLVYEYVPGANGLRAIARYVLVLTLPVSIAFAVAFQRAQRWIAALHSDRVRIASTTALFAVVAFGVAEQFGRAPGFSAHAERARLEQLASSLPEDCAVFYAAAAPVPPARKREYQIDAMLVSGMRGIPTVNGYGGHTPRGWMLQEVESPEYQHRVDEWIATHHLNGPVCRLEIAD
jgi:hypothetical protein